MPTPHPVAAVAPEAQPAAIPPCPPGVSLVTLDNGLTVIVREDHSAPVVSAQAWCRAGSIDEGQWLGAGLSHVLEHMLFKGTSNRPGNRIDQEIQEAGGYVNAYTSFDRTVYWINVPNTGARVAVDVLADIMQHATLPEATLAKEMDVIRREMDMCQDDPQRRSSRRLFETAYTRSPYRFTVIGYPDVFDRLQREDILAYYREKYVPNNLFFVVVGDLVAAEAVDQLRQAFGSAKLRPLALAVLPEEPQQLAPRELIEEAPIELGHLHLSWHIPHLRHPDIPALDVMAVLLGGGRSSRLYQNVREQKGLVSSVEAWTYSPGNPGLFGMSALMEADRFAAAREAMLAELEQMKDGAISPAEVGKAVKQFVAGTLAARKTMQGQAQDLGANWMAAGDLNFSERYLAAVKRLTPDDVRRVARTYLSEANRTVYALVPPGVASRAACRVEATSEHPVKRLELPNGLRLLIKEDHRLPFVEFRMALRGGVLAETTRTNGLTQLLARMLLQGTERRTAAQLATEIESLGGHLDTYGGNNSLGVNLEVLREDFATGLDVLTDVLLRPAFPADALERERQVQLAAIKAQRDQVLQSAIRLFRRSLFGAQGYGLDPLGSEPSIQAITADDLRGFYAQCVRPADAVLAIYGDLDSALVEQAVIGALGEWRSFPKAGAPTGSQGPESGDGVQHVEESRDKKQAIVVLGFPGTILLDPNRFALELIQEACSDLGSRVFLRIRERLGLAYFVGAQHFLGLVPGYFAFYAGTAPGSAAAVEAELLKEVHLLRTEGLSAEELKRAKAKLLGQKKIARQDLGTLAQTHVLDELYGLGYANSEAEDARFEAVTLAEVLAVAQQYLTPDHYVSAMVLPSDSPEPPQGSDSRAAGS